MQLPKEGADDGLPDGFDWIAQKVVFLRSERSENQKWSDNFSLFFCMQFLGDDIHQLSRYGFDWIIGKMILHHASCTLLHHVACLLNVCWMLFWLSERSNLGLGDLFELIISQKRCMLWPMFTWNTYTKSYIIVQFTLRSLTSDDP